MSIAWAGVGHCVCSDCIKLRCIFVAVRSYGKMVFASCSLWFGILRSVSNITIQPTSCCVVVINSINLIARAFPVFEPRSHYLIDPSLFMRPNFTLPLTERHTCIRTAPWLHLQASSAQPCYSWSCRRSHPEPWPAWGPRRAR